METASASGIRIETLPDLAALRREEPAWAKLARASAEPNPFYEPWFFIPAAEHLGESEGLRFVVAKDAATGEWRGFFPLRLRPTFTERKLPLANWELWRHRHCFLTTPLIDRAKVEPALQAFWAWARAESSLFVWSWIRADGPVHAALEAVLGGSGWVSRDQSFERALWVKPDDPEAYLASAISGSHRRDFRRLERRLAEEADLSCRIPATEAEAAAWCEVFLKLEASGWKGKSGTALSSNEGEATFFRELAREGFRRGSLRLGSFVLGESTVAARCELVSNEGGFLFKIAYDEKYSKNRPGFLLELRYVTEYSERGLAWSDSCALPDHPMIDRLWAERRKITTLSIARHWSFSAVVVMLVAKLRGMRRGKKKAT